MASPVETPARRPAGPLPPQWPAEATDAIVTAVGTVRDRTTGPALTAARAIVYGVFAAILGVIAIVLAIAMIIRMANNYLPGEIGTVYIGLGTIFTLGGLVLWSKAFSAPPAES